MTKIKWALDPAHSSVDFSVRHMMIANVKGTFNKFDAAIDADPSDLTTASIEFSVDTASVDTRNQDRDGHLVSALQINSIPETCISLAARNFSLFSWII
jgi:polyisoprenoid-binding protein YceI